MERTMIAFILGSSTFLANCDSQEANPKTNTAKARVLAYSCRGTVLEFIDYSEDIGENWTYFENIYPPHKSSDARVSYKRTVTAFGIPNNREVVGDTLEISFQQISQQPGPTCALGFGPNSLIKITRLK